jgi:hypothetical protein
MRDIPDEWLEKMNQSYRREDVPIDKRPWRAIEDWSKAQTNTVLVTSEQINKVFNWFEKNSKAGSLAMGSIYTGAFYFDSSFWPVHIPRIYGQVNLDPFDALNKMPAQIMNQLRADTDKISEYINLWVDCLDYAYTIIYSSDKMLQSAHKELVATVSLMLEIPPRAKAVESARMATEMFLKAFLLMRGVKTIEQVEKKLKHNLTTAIECCIKVTDRQELRMIRDMLKCFPSIRERYEGKERSSKEIWRCYATAQFTGSTIMRLITGKIRSVVTVDKS